ncbi:methionyl aminopeptidase [Streptosporangium album]|uniref:Methionyl aminopeptidase n=1 Tax=Streptosporangium album TaxID=47479 RepID=A0A7W7S4T5_9ACTN|nr:M24 family metallopeptidase [Streptosporangium album]MBB4943522.1 methionyl aminopeptidase [Streptosporangium album]
MVEIKTAAELDAMREAGRVVAEALAAVRAHATTGVSLLELNEVAETVIREAGAKPAFPHYKPAFAPTPFPAVICTSVNEVIVHGIPGTYRLRAQDLLSVDCGAYLDGWAGDAAVSFTVGPAHPADLRLIDAADAALRAGIAACVPGGRLGDIGHAVARAGREAGYGIPDDFGGHGIGRAMHEPVTRARSPGRAATSRATTTRRAPSRISRTSTAGSPAVSSRSRVARVWRRRTSSASPPVGESTPGGAGT